jgi:hypothetical protein
MNWLNIGRKDTTVICMRQADIANLEKNGNAFTRSRPKQSRFIS